jgi:hypothetical protein
LLLLLLFMSHLQLGFAIVREVFEQKVLGKADKYQLKA